MEDKEHQSVRKWLELLLPPYIRTAHMMVCKSTTAKTRVTRKSGHAIQKWKTSSQPIVKAVMKVSKKVWGQSIGISADCVKDAAIVDALQKRKVLLEGQADWGVVAGSVRYLSISYAPRSTLTFWVSLGIKRRSSTGSLQDQ